MDDKNRQQLFILSCLFYGFTGALVIITGMILNSAAAYFAISDTQMGSTFTFMNSGILISIFLNVWLMDLIPLKRQINIGFLLVILAIIGLFISKSLLFFSICIFVLGIVSGISMSIGTYLVTKIYDGSQRSTRMLITDSFFSMAGIIFPILAGWLLSHHFAWYWVYLTIGGLYFVAYLLAMISTFPKVTEPTGRLTTNREKERWGFSITLLAIAALCYILGQLAFIQWIPRYTEDYFNFTIAERGKLVSHFWSSYMIGMWCFSFIVRFFDLQRLVTVLSGLATITMFLFIHTTNSSLLAFYIIALGFLSSAIYTTIITLASLQTKTPSAKLVNFILTCGTIGTMLTFVVTAPIVDYFNDVIVALKSANGLYFIVTICCLLLSFSSRHRQHSRK